MAPTRRLDRRRYRLQQQPQPQQQQWHLHLLHLPLPLPVLHGLRCVRGRRCDAVARRQMVPCAHRRHRRPNPCVLPAGQQARTCRSCPRSQTSRRLTPSLPRRPQRRLKIRAVGSPRPTPASIHVWHKCLRRHPGRSRRGGPRRVRRRRRQLHQQRHRRPTTRLPLRLYPTTGAPAPRCPGCSTRWIFCPPPQHLLRTCRRRRHRGPRFPPTPTRRQPRHSRRL